MHGISGLISVLGGFITVLKEDTMKTLFNGAQCKIADLTGVQVTDWSSKNCKRSQNVDEKNLKLIIPAKAKNKVQGKEQKPKAYFVGSGQVLEFNVA